MSEVPGVHFAATPAPRKIAERLVSPTPRPAAPLTSATEKLARVGRLIPKTPIVFPLLPSDGYTASPHLTSALRQVSNTRTTGVSAPLLLPKSQKDITTGALTGTSREAESELQVTGMAQGAKTQFKPYPGKRD